MRIIKLIHWKAEEVGSREELLNAAGFRVDSQLESSSIILTQLTNNPPAAIVIDLSRLPSQGRDFALMVRKRRGTRTIPLVFVGGQDNKVEQVKKLIPDASYTSWDDIKPALEWAIANPPLDPIVPDSIFAGYAGKSLWKKLGIKPNMIVCLVNPPLDFRQTLGSIPEKVKIISDQNTSCNLTIWFCYSQDDLEHNISGIVAQSSYGPIWIAWPKQKSSAASDLTQQSVRQIGMANNLVDYKISAFDKTWSGLLFRFREKKLS